MVGKQKEPHPKTEDTQDDNNVVLNLKNKNKIFFIILILVIISFFICQLYSNFNNNDYIELNDKKCNEENSIHKLSEKKNSKTLEIGNIESLVNKKREMKKQQHQSNQKQNQQKSTTNMVIEGNIKNANVINHGHKENSIVINVNDCQFQGVDKKQRSPEITFNFNF
ncbi:hypothetical protein ACTFIZ_008854 [Dictyostelium cf. discoideum]